MSSFEVGLVKAPSALDMSENSFFGKVLDKFCMYVRIKAIVGYNRRRRLEFFWRLRMACVALEGPKAKRTYGRLSALRDQSGVPVHGSGLQAFTCMDGERKATAFATEAPCVDLPFFLRALPAPFGMWLGVLLAVTAKRQLPRLGCLAASRCRRGDTM